MAVARRAAILAAAALTAMTPGCGRLTTPGPPTGIEGTWKSVGYGKVIEIVKGHGGKRRLTTYETTSISCLGAGSQVELQDKGGEVAFGESGDREVTVRREGDHALLHVLGNVTDIRLTWLKNKPDCPSHLPSDDAARRLKAFDIFWQTFAEHYPPYAGRLLDWSERDRDRAALVQDNTDDKLDGLLREMVRKLGDIHTYVGRRNKETSGLRPGTRNEDSVDQAAVRTAVQARLGAPLTPVLKGMVEYAAGLPGGLGYLRVTQLQDFGGEDDSSYDTDRAKFTRALDTVFRQGAKDQWRGLILDLRLNDGGYDALGLELAGRLTQKPHFAFKKRTRNLGDPSGFTPFQDFAVQPSHGPGFHGPVALLVSDLTISAGETSAMAIMNRSPTPTVIGRETQGVFADEQERRLPGGWSFTLSTEDYRTAGNPGQSFEGRGLPVDTRFRSPVFEPDELAGRCDSAIAKALDRLTGAVLGTTPPCPQTTAR